MIFVFKLQACSSKLWSKEHIINFSQELRNIPGMGWCMSMSRWSDFSVNPWFYLSFFSLKGSFTWLAIGPQILQDLTKCSTTSTGISFYIFAIFFITVNTECFKLALFVGPVFIEPIRTSAEGGKQIVLFPEGTNLTPKVRFSKSASQEQSWPIY